MRVKCLVRLSTEYAWKGLERMLIGDPSWIKRNQFDFKKWFRHFINEPDEVPRVVAEYVQIRGQNLLKAIKHWGEVLHQTNQLIDLQDFPNCPEILTNKLVLVIGDDSGQGHTR